ncbi:MAG: ParB/Srx family N-terminal domain-containing protein [Endomicrobiaceae bacterium]|nr:ParB/Srx family N-terminal domain-containing protein [Endomicrobiaceae bacterium]
MQEGININNLSVEYVDVSVIKQYKNNPKVHNNKQVEQIINSIKAFNFNNPILIDEKNEIIAGHGRLLAAHHLQMGTVPVIRLTHLTEAQKRAYRIADNKLTENGAWDINLLTLEFSELEKLDLDFELDLTGFDNIEIDNLLHPVIPDSKLNNIPFINNDEIISKQGDIWQLGKHLIICGNSLEEKTYTDLMGSKQASEMLWQDLARN